MTAQQLRAEMNHVQAVTDRLRGTLNHLEGQAELGEGERGAVLARRAALDHEASQMRDGFMVREQQLIEVSVNVALLYVHNIKCHTDLAYSSAEVLLEIRR